MAHQLEACAAVATTWSGTGCTTPSFVPGEESGVFSSQSSPFFSRLLAQYHCSRRRTHLELRSHRSFPRPKAVGSELTPVLFHPRPLADNAPPPPGTKISRMVFVRCSLLFMWSKDVYSSVFVSKTDAKICVFYCLKSSFCNGCDKTLLRCLVRVEVLVLI